MDVKNNINIAGKINIIDIAAVKAGFPDEAVEKTRKIAENYKEKLQVDFQIEATTSREEALKGADFCLISIEVGNRFELWEQDWGVPVEYGFKQII